MKSRGNLSRRNLSRDGLTTPGRKKRSKKTLGNGRDNPLPLPIDLVFEIFSRLPVKSIAICLCVSKTWASILRRQDFTEFRLRARPKLLFACQKGGDLLFFSAPQPQNPDENSSPVVVSCHMKFDFDAYFRGGQFEIIRGLDQGLMGLTSHEMIGQKIKYLAPVICNPSTGQILPMTRVKTTRVRSRNLFGYDPIDKQFKVLSVSEEGYGFNNSVCKEHQLITLRRGKLSQRMIHSDRILHYLEHSKERCINGVLYYKAIELGTYILVCFDVRSEKFNYIKVKKSFIRGTMVNYNGKLGLLLSGDYDFINVRCTSVTLWVLEDIEKQEWSEHIYVLPALWKDIVGSRMLCFVGMTRTNEIVMKPESDRPGPFHLFYFNTEKKTVVRVEIQGIERILSHHFTRVHIFLDHVENATLTLSI